MIEDAVEQHNRQIDALVNGFEMNLQRVTSHAVSQIAAEMAQRLTIVDGAIADTAGNQQALRTLGAVIDAELARAGYNRVINGFVNDFAGQLPWFQQILHELTGLEFKVKFGARDLQFFAGRQKVTEQILRDEIDRGILTAKQRALFSVAGTPMRDLVAELSVAMNTTVAKAGALADTALPGFYRTIANRGYDQIESASGVLEFTYFGPRDKLNRQFCKKLLALAKSGTRWTRAQIANMRNGDKQPRPVIIYCGGYRCRHQFGPTGLKK